MGKLPPFQAQAMGWIERFGGTAYRIKTGQWTPYGDSTRKINERTIMALVGRGLLVVCQYSMYRKPNGYLQRPTVCAMKGKKAQAINLVSCVVNPDHIIGVK